MCEISLPTSLLMQSFAYRVITPIQTTFFLLQSVTATYRPYSVDKVICIGFMSILLGPQELATPLDTTMSWILRSFNYRQCHSLWILVTSPYFNYSRNYNLTFGITIPNGWSFPEPSRNLWSRGGYLDWSGWVQCKSHLTRDVLTSSSGKIFHFLYCLSLMFWLWIQSSSFEEPRWMLPILVCVGLLM